MPKKKRPHNRPRKNTHPRNSPRGRSRGSDPELGSVVETALRDHPLSLLELASTYLNLLDPRGQHPLDTDTESPPPLSEIVEALILDATPATDALLLVFAALLDDEAIRMRIRLVVEARKFSIPEWLHHLDDAEVTRTVESVTPLDDGVNIILGVRLGDIEFTLLVYVDHNMGTLVKDAFAVAQPFESVIAAWDQVDYEAESEVRILTEADARARVTGTIEHSLRVYPPIETETWPAIRPLVEWVVRTLPTGGRGFEWRGWEDDELDSLAEGFFASRHGEAFDSAEVGWLVDELLVFGGSTAAGDPLRWSPVAVEMLLVDWIPRKVVADADHLARVPDLLRAFIRYAHETREIPTHLTDETVEAVGAWEAEYRELINTPRHQGPMAILDRMGLLGDTPPDGPEDLAAPSDFDVFEFLIGSLEREVGGQRALDELHTDPLPDEQFDWTDIPEDVHDRVTEILELSDNASAQLFGEEYRTATRRFLADVARADPAIFRRAGKTEVSAASVCWVVGKANDAFSPYRFQVKQLLAHFGVTGSVSQRATSMLNALGVERRTTVTMSLGTPRYLVSEHRQQILDLLAQYRPLRGPG